MSNVQLSPNYKLAEIKSLIFPQNGFFKELGVVGLLGSDAFGQAVLTFDACEQIMIINYPYRPFRFENYGGRAYGWRCPSTVCGR